MKWVLALIAGSAFIAVAFFGFTLFGHSAHGTEGVCPPVGFGLFACTKIGAIEMATSHIGDLNRALVGTLVFSVLLLIVTSLISRARDKDVLALEKNRYRHVKRDIRETIIFAEAGLAPFRVWSARLVNSPNVF